jgi:hypothetical protein
VRTSLFFEDSRPHRFNLKICPNHLFRPPIASSLSDEIQACVQPCLKFLSHAWVALYNFLSQTRVHFFIFSFLLFKRKALSVTSACLKQRPSIQVALQACRQGFSNRYHHLCRCSPRSFRYAFPSPLVLPQAYYGYQASPQSYTLI